MPIFLVTLAIAVPLAVAFAMWFASLFEIPFQRHRSWAAWRDVVSGPVGREELGVAGGQEYDALAPGRTAHNL